MTARKTRTELRSGRYATTGRNDVVAPVDIFLENSFGRLVGLVVLGTKRPFFAETPFALEHEDFIVILNTGRRFPVEFLSIPGNGSIDRQLEILRWHEHTHLHREFVGNEWVHLVLRGRRKGEQADDAGCRKEIGHNWLFAGGNSASF
jgi:hypothetical protein